MTLGDILSFIDSKKRVVGDSLSQLGSDPAEFLAQALARLKEDVPARAAAPAPGATFADIFHAATNPDAVLGSPAANAAMGFAGLGIISPAKAATLGYKTTLPQSEEFAQAVANTPGASITPEGLRMALQRAQQPEQALEPSTRGGVFYLPQGDTRSRFYGTGLYGYGGGEKIAGETLLQNPLFAKGATGGMAPKVAYDTLAGKGSYDAMRTDALNTQRWAPREPGAPSMTERDATAAQVQTFLEKYAPELSHLSDYIVEHSAKGNQLAYALQEAAVGSAARKAGYDSILGFSRKRTGEPFLSELFDIRESHYPDAFGTSRAFPPELLRP